MQLSTYKNNKNIGAKEKIRLTLSTKAKNEWKIATKTNQLHDKFFQS